MQPGRVILARSLGELVGRPPLAASTDEVRPYGGAREGKVRKVTAAEGNMQEVSRFGW